MLRKSVCVLVALSMLLFVAGRTSAVPTIVEYEDGCSMVAEVELAAEQALSTEPQVLWRKRGTIHHSSDPPGYWYVEMGSAEDQTLDSFDLLKPTGVHGEEVDVIILSHSKEK